MSRHLLAKRVEPDPIVYGKTGRGVDTSYVLPTVSVSTLPMKEIDWRDLPKRYINPGEAEALIALANLVSAVNGMEIGCNMGRTSRLLLDNVPTLEKLIGVDVLPGYHFNKSVQRRELPTHPGAYAKGDPRFDLRLTAFGSLDLRAEDLPPLDFIFIDGDHSKHAVMHDSELARRCIRPGGVIVWHDYHLLGNVDVKECLDEQRKAGHDIRLIERTWLAFERF